MSSDLNEGDRYAENEQEEAQAEMREQREIDSMHSNLNGEDIDRAYDTMRDDNSMTLIEGVQELIDKVKDLPYYRNRKEGMAKDIIQNTLRLLDLKVKVVRNITPKFQDIEFKANGEENEIKNLTGSPINEDIKADEHLDMPIIPFRAGLNDAQLYTKTPYDFSKEAEMTESQAKSECERIAIKSELEKEDEEKEKES
jgi:hypothetical protein